MHRPRQGMLKIYAKIMPFKEVVIQTLCYIYLYFWDAGLTIKTHTHNVLQFLWFRNLWKYLKAFINDSQHRQYILHDYTAKSNPN